MKELNKIVAVMEEEEMNNLLVGKRDGTLQKFDKTKIYKAIKAASDETEQNNTGYGIYDGDIATIVDEVVGELEISTLLTKEKANIFEIETIQDVVQDKLMINGYYKVATNYIEYRYKRKLAREFKERDNNILALIRGTNEELNTENSNKNTALLSTQRDYMAGEVSKDLAKRVLLPKDIVQAHEDGAIHFHKLIVA